MMSKNLFSRDCSLNAIRQRYGMAAIKTSLKTDPVLYEAIRDIPFLLSELITMTPKADEHGRVTLEVEELKEQVAALEAKNKEQEEELVELRYEVKLSAYSGIGCT